MALIGAVDQELALQLLEIGGVLLMLGLLSYLASRLEISPVPVFLLTGLAFGEGGLTPLDLSQNFLSTGAQIGAILLLLLLGLEYSVQEIATAVSGNKAVAFVDLLNAIPGIVLGLWLNLGWIGIVALAGITYTSSSGIAAQLIRETGWQRSALAKRTVSVLVVEDLVLAPYLPFITAVGAGLSVATGLISVGVAVAITGLVLVIGAKHPGGFSRVLNAREPNALLLTVFGIALLAGGAAAVAGFSSAVAAFLVGLILTGEVAEAVRLRLSPLRDFFAALFFLFFGLSVAPEALANVWIEVVAISVVSAGFKLVTGWVAGKGSTDNSHRLRIGAYLVPHGEFSILIASLLAATAIGPKLEAITIGYVILTSFIGSIWLKFLRSPLAN